MRKAHSSNRVIDNLLFTVLASFVTLALFDEALRKFLGPSGIYVTFLKDLLLIYAAAAAYKTSRLPDGILLCLIFSVIYTAFSAANVFFLGGSLSHLLASIKVYIVFSAGVILGSCIWNLPHLLEIFSRVFVLGMVVVALVSVVQEYGRGILPLALQQNNFRDIHSGASGLYVEGTFGSPQTLSIFALASLVLLFVFRRELVPNKFVFPFLVFLMMHTIYVSRIRYTIVFLFIFLGLLLLSWVRRPVFRSSYVPFVFLCVIMVVGLLPYVTARLEIGFLLNAFQWSEIVDRLSAASFTQLSGAERWFGYGAGTTGRLAALLTDSTIAPRAYFDSGLSQTLTQLGNFGALPLFLLLLYALFFSILVMSRFIFVGSRRLISFGVAFICFYTVSFFLVKQNTVMVNGASGALMGIFAGCVLSFRSHNR